MIHDTKAGHKVRSKSEVLIANALYDRGITHRYDSRFNGGGRTFYPDFELLRPADREIIIWEHLGRIDLPDYVDNVLDKLIVYGRRGFTPGQNLIITRETISDPLTMGKIDTALKEYGLVPAAIDCIGSRT